MYETSFTQILSSFDEDDLRSFGKWLNSSWCNSNKNLILLFKKVKSYHPDFKHKNFSKEKLRKNIKTGKVFSNSEFENLMSKALIQVKRFLIFQTLNEDEVGKSNYLIEAYQKRHLDKFFFKEFDDLNKHFIKNREKGFADYLQITRNYWLQYLHPISQNPIGVVEKLSESLDYSFRILKGILLNEKINLNRLLPDTNFEIVEEKQKWLDSIVGYENRSIELSEMRLRFLDSEELLLSVFEQRVDFFSVHLEQLNKDDQKIHLFYLLNDAKRLRKEGLISIKEYFHLYEKGIDQSILPYFGKLTYVSFTSLIVTANWVRNFEFSRKVVREYLPKFSSRIKEDCKYWANAHINYSIGKFEESDNYLTQHEFVLPHFKVLTRGLKLQILFDIYLQNKSEWETAMNYCESCNKWMRREKTRGGAMKKSFVRFVEKVEAMLRKSIEPDFDEKRFTQILNEKNLNIQGIDWLKKKQEQIIEMRKKKM